MKIIIFFAFLLIIIFAGLILVEKQESDFGRFFVAASMVEIALFYVFAINVI